MEKKFKHFLLNYIAVIEKKKNHYSLHSLKRILIQIACLNFTVVLMKYQNGFRVKLQHPKYIEFYFYKI